MRQARLPNWKIAQLVNPKNTSYQQNCKNSFPMLSPVQKHPVRTSRSVRPGPSAPARPPWPVRPGPFVRPGPTWDMGPGPWIWILPEIMAMADGHGHRPYNHGHGLLMLSAAKHARRHRVVLLASRRHITPPRASKVVLENGCFIFPRYAWAMVGPPARLGPWAMAHEP